MFREGISVDLGAWGWSGVRSRSGVRVMVGSWGLTVEGLGLVEV